MSGRPKRTASTRPSAGKPPIPRGGTSGNATVLPPKLPPQPVRTANTKAAFSTTLASAPSRKRRSGSVITISINSKHESAAKSKMTTDGNTKTKPMEKSTITTVASSVKQMNVFDAVLAEASDLAQAASEAQHLGRFKMASSYLLLLHARLVGLGKRFDKAERPKGMSGGDQQHASTSSKLATNKKNEKMDESTDIFASPQKKSTASSAAKDAAKNASTKLLTPNTAKTLSQMLPDDIELDQAMMEHLAKAAAELHAARCCGNAKRQRLVTDFSPGMT